MLPPHSDRQPTGNSRTIEILTSEELKALIRACSGRASTGLRNRALLVLGWVHRGPRPDDLTESALSNPRKGP